MSMQKCSMTMHICSSSFPGMSVRWDIAYLEHVKKVTGKSLSAIAKDAGVSSTTLTRPASDPDNTYMIKAGTLDKIKDATGIDYSQFASHAEEFESEATGPVVEMPRRRSRSALIPVFDVSASAGGGAALADYEAEATSLAFPRNYLSKLTSNSIDNLAIISVKGESMEPTLLDDDIVLLDASKTNLSYDGLFVLRFDDALHVKRVGRSPKKGHITVISDNSSLYPPMVMAIEDVHAVGKVLWYGRKV